MTVELNKIAEYKNKICIANLLFCMVLFFLALESALSVVLSCVACEVVAS